MAIKIIKGKKRPKKTENKITKNGAKKTVGKRSVKKASQNKHVRSVVLTDSPKIPYGVRVLVKPENKIKEKKNEIKKSIKKIFRNVIILLFIICLAFSSVYAYNHLMSYLCSLERFFIENIEVNGCKNITESEIMNTIPFKVGETAIGINLWQFEKDLMNIKSELKKVSAYRRNWFGKGKKIKVVVSLTEREPEVFIYNKGNKEGLDFDNKPFNLRGNMSLMQIPFLLYDTEQDRQTLLHFYKNLKTYFSDLIPEMKEIKFGELDDIVITMNNGTEIYWGYPKESKIKEKVRKFFAISKDLANKKQGMDYIDLSFLDVNKDKVIVKISNINEEVKK
ncbi:MAG: cell division protein FtsQ/DivIB [Elusimicrobia bacterium]|nr:cell division protein FtsQ/DivIB [Elusimicrobiota bacterium]